MEEGLLSLQARNYRLAQSEAERVFLDEAIWTIRDDPTQGIQLPFPWQTGARELNKNGYHFIYIYIAENHYFFIRTIQLSPL